MQVFHTGCFQAPSFHPQGINSYALQHNLNDIGTFIADFVTNHQAVTVGIGNLRPKHHNAEGTGVVCCDIVWRGCGYYYKVDSD